MSMRSALTALSLTFLASCGGGNPPPEEPIQEHTETTPFTDTAAQAVIEPPRDLTRDERIEAIRKRVENMGDAELRETYYSYLCDPTEVYDEENSEEFEAFYTGQFAERRMVSNSEMPYSRISEYAPLAIEDGATNTMIPMAAAIIADKASKFFPAPICVYDPDIAAAELDNMRAELDILDNLSPEAFSRFASLTFPEALQNISLEEVKAIQLAQIELLETALPKMAEDGVITINEVVDLLFDANKTISLSGRIDIAPGVKPVLEKLLDDIGYEGATDQQVNEMASQLSAILVMIDNVQKNQTELGTIFERTDFDTPEGP